MAVVKVADLEGLAALADPARRALYDFVAGAGRDVGRDEAAKAVGVSRGLAGFHLDRLVQEGLLRASFKRLSGRSGPGAGRPAKVYRRSAREVEVSLPPRTYDLAARLLATAIETSGSPRARRALTETAKNLGREVGAKVLAASGRRAGRRRLLDGMVGALESQGYEPAAGPGEVRLRNCPFHALVPEHRELVCGMNLALVGGMVEGLGVPGVQPVLDPSPTTCCVCVKVSDRDPGAAHRRDGERSSRAPRSTRP